MSTTTTTPTPSAPAMPLLPSTRYLLACGLAPLLFIVVLLIEGATRPGYDPIHRFGSELSLGDQGWMQITNVVVTGLLVLAFAVGLRRVQHPGRGAVAGPVLTGVFGLSLILAGVFVMDPLPGYPPGVTVPAMPTLPDTLHGLAGVAAFWSAGAAAVVLGRRLGRGGPWWWYSLATGALTPVSWLVTGILFALSQDGTLTNAPHGLVQRVGVVISFGYFSLLAVRLLRRPPSA
jgi:Protein of unknown function (DUF998)